MWDCLPAPSGCRPDQQTQQGSGEDLCDYDENLVQRVFWKTVNGYCLPTSDWRDFAVDTLTLIFPLYLNVLI